MSTSLWATGRVYTVILNLLCALITMQATDVFYVLADSFIAVNDEEEIGEGDSSSFCKN